MATYRWYSVGQDPRDERNPDTAGRVVILGWSRDRSKALSRPGTIEAYRASSREMAARMAKADRGFEIDWRKF